MAGVKTVVLVASPGVRTMCPPDMTEGRWMDIPAEGEEVQFIGWDGGAATLLARPTGRMVRRDDLVSAPVWEIRRAEDWS